MVSPTPAASPTSRTASDSLVESSTDSRCSSFPIAIDLSPESTTDTTSSTAASPENVTIPSPASSEALTTLKKHIETMNKAKIKNNLLILIVSTIFIIVKKISLFTSSNFKKNKREVDYFSYALIFIVFEILELL